MSSWWYTRLIPALWSHGILDISGAMVDSGVFVSQFPDSPTSLWTEQSQQEHHATGFHWIQLQSICQPSSTMHHSMGSSGHVSWNDGSILSDQITHPKRSNPWTVQQERHSRDPRVSLQHRDPGSQHFVGLPFWSQETRLLQFVLDDCLVSDATDELPSWLLLHVVQVMLTKWCHLLPTSLTCLQSSP